jgi:hypothetical protein
VNLATLHQLLASMQRLGTVGSYSVSAVVAGCRSQMCETKLALLATMQQLLDSSRDESM